jgi:hypothetical protein
MNEKVFEKTLYGKIRDQGHSFTINIRLNCVFLDQLVYGYHIMGNTNEAIYMIFKKSYCTTYIGCVILHKVV